MLVQATHPYQTSHWMSFLELAPSYSEFRTLANIDTLSFCSAHDKKSLVVSVKVDYRQDVS